MAAATDYITGTISLTNGEVEFTGAGTGWLLAQFKEGDTIIDITGATEFMGVIATIDANGAGTLTKAWEGPTLTNVSYRMRYHSENASVSAQARNLIELLGNGNLQAVAGLSGSANRVLMFTGPGTMTTVPKSDLVSGADYDVQVADEAALAAYDGQSTGFAVLVSDDGAGRAYIVSKLSNTSGDWSDPAYVTGPTGPLPVITVGEVTTGDPGTEVEVVGTPTVDGVELDFTIPAGEGFLSRGDYAGGTTYAKGDVVQQSGSSWTAKQATTGNAPPTLPTTSNTYWQLLARKGTDGAGTVSSVAAGTGVSVSSTDPTAPVVNVVAFTGDSGSGGTVGGVPAPSAGDAAAGKVLGAGGAWVSQAGEETIQSYWMPSNLELAELSPAALLIGMGDGNGVFDGFASLNWVDVAGATGLDASEQGALKPQFASADVWAPTLTTNIASWSNANARILIDNTQISTSGTAVRLTLVGASTGSTLVVSNMAIGHRAASGNPYDFSATPTAVTVGGSANFSIPVGATVLTDWITFALDETKDLIYAFHTVSGSLRAAGLLSGTVFYQLTGSSTTMSATTSGLNTAGSNDAPLVSKIEVRTGGAVDMHVKSQTINLSQEPTWGRLVAIVEENDAGVNSDIVFGLSRDGADFASLTMSEKFTRADGSIYVDSGIVNLSSLDPGDTARWSIQTDNGKSPKILAVGSLFGVGA